MGREPRMLLATYEIGSDKRGYQECRLISGQVSRSLTLLVASSRQTCSFSLRPTRSASSRSIVAWTRSRRPKIKLTFKTRKTQFTLETDNIPIDDHLIENLRSLLQNIE
jgi:hypothetical protein